MMAFVPQASPLFLQLSKSRFTGRRPRTYENPLHVIRRFQRSQVTCHENNIPENFSSSVVQPNDSNISNTHDALSGASAAGLPGTKSSVDESSVSGVPSHNACGDMFMRSTSLEEHYEQRQAGLRPSGILSSTSNFTDAWALAVGDMKGLELKNQYSRVGILIERNFPDFEPHPMCKDVYEKASLYDIALAKSKAVYKGTGLPAISEVHDLTIDPPDSGSRINKSLQQGYYTRNVAEEGDAMIDRVRPISDNNRVTTFTSVVVYYDGDMEITKSRKVNVAMAFSGAHYLTIATTAALDDLYKELSKRLLLTLEDSSRSKTAGDGDDEGDEGKVLVGATLLKERILRDGKMLGDGILKVSSFMNHMVDSELMEVCGEELAERLRYTIPNKVLTAESTGLIAGLPTARMLGIPLVFARKSRPITISDSYQTTYRSSTKGTTHELIVSCEYLESGDRVLIIDDFLAGGSTAEALFKLAKMAHARVVGVGVLIEKVSDGGRAFLSGYDVPVESLAKILPDSGNGRITFAEEEGSEVKRNRKERKLERKRAMAEAEYYSRTGESLKREEDATVTGANEDEDLNEVDVIGWDDERQDALDDLEDSLVRQRGKF